MAHPTHCIHCRAALLAPRSRLLAGSLLTVAYLVAFTYVFGLSLMGPLGIMFLPFVVPLGVGAITSAHTYASEPEACPECGKIVEPQSAQVRPSVSRPVHATAA